MINPFEEIIERLERIELAIVSLKELNPVAQIINRKELCVRLAITETTAIAWGHQGKLPFIKVGSAVRYNWPDVLEALENKKAVLSKDDGSYRRAFLKAHSQEVSEKYAMKLITKRTGVKTKDTPEELVELIRRSIKLKREIKNLKNDTTGKKA